MADERRGAYAEVESLKKGKYKIGKDYKRFELIFAVVFTFVLMSFFAADFFSTEFILLSPFAYYGGSYTGTFKYGAFFPIMLVILFIVYIFVDGKFFYKRRHIKPLYNIVNFPFKIIGLLFYIPKDLRERLGLQAFYLKKLEDEFFYQIIAKEDGYSRAKELTIFADRKYLFGKEYKDIKKLFRSEEEFNDLFYIIEGYLTKSRLYDTMLYHYHDDLFDGNYINKMMKIYDKIGKKKNSSIKKQEKKRNLFRKKVDKEENKNTDYDTSSLTENELKEFNKFKAILVKTENEIKDRIIKEKTKDQVDGSIVKNLKALHLYSSKPKAEMVQTEEELQDKTPQKFTEDGKPKINKFKNGSKIKILQSEFDELVKKELIKEMKIKNYDYFQTYMLRPDEKGILKDNVTLSLNAIRIFMEDKKALFRKFLTEEAFSFSRAVSTPKKEFAKRFYVLMQDTHFRKKITANLDEAEKKRVLGVFDNLINLEKEKAERIRRGEKRKRGERRQSSVSIFDDEKIMGYLVDMLMADFTLVLFRMVMNQFMNIPAGTMVVKIESYDTRMILEYYTQFVMIEIEAKKNDGQSELFQSDNYVNLFFILFARFVDEPKNEVFSELYFKFNTMEYVKPFSFNELKEVIDKEGMTNAIEKANYKNLNNLETLDIGKAQEPLDTREKEPLMATN